MMDEQERRKKELLEQVLARQAAAKEAKRYTLQEAEQIDADLRAAEAAAEAEAAEALAAAEAAEMADASGDPKAEKVQQPLMQVKIEEEEIEQLQELSSLRHCMLCNTRNYLRQGLCANLLCKGFYMLDPHAAEKLCSKGRYEWGAKWSPAEWQRIQQPKVECRQLSQALQDGLAEYKDELAEAMQVPEAPLPAAETPLIIEDLESGDIQEHPSVPPQPSVPPELHNMGEECQQAIAQAANKKRSKGVKRSQCPTSPWTKRPGWTEGSRRQFNQLLGADSSRSTTGSSGGLVKDLCVLWITALQRDRHAELIFQKKRSLLLLLFEVQDLLR